MKLHIEGWRELPQSFAVVNQFQCLELLNRDGIELSHFDAPLPPTQMLSVNRAWPRVTSLFSADVSAALAHIPSLTLNELPDIIFRLFFPADFSQSSAPRTFVFCVTETGPLAPYMIQTGQSVVNTLAQNDVQLITPSAWSKRGLVAGGVPADRVHIVPHGVDPEIYRPLPRIDRTTLRRSMGWEDSFVFMNLSNLYSWKGIEILLKAFAVVAERYANARLMLKGIDSIYSSRKSLQSMTQRLTRRECTMIESKLGYVGETFAFQNLANFYQAADALAAPYLAEGFNLPVLEAMACGLPVICTSGGPTDEFVGEGLTIPISSHEITMQQDNRYQLLPDLDHLIADMSDVIENETLREHIYTHAPIHVHENYTWRHAVDRLIEVIADDPV